MIATLTFRVPQAALDIYGAITLASILGEKPRTVGAFWIFQIELEIDEAEDEICANSQAWAYWTENFRGDICAAFPGELSEIIEESLAITIQEQEEEDRPEMIESYGAWHHSTTF